MTSHQFFINKEKTRISRVSLGGGEHRHLSLVLRARPGDLVRLFDEEGTRYTATVESIHKDCTFLVINETVRPAKPKVDLTLAQALLKSPKMDFVVQKATELGVAAIIPIEAARSVVKPGDNAEKKLKRWRRIAQEAAKQSGTPVVPFIERPLTLDELVERRKGDRKLLLSENRGKLLRDILIPGPDSSAGAGSVLILIGPEGGWTEEEEVFLQIGRAHV